MADQLPDTIQWKQDYLGLKDAIEKFQKRHMTGISEYRPPISDPSQGNVGRLLSYHLGRCREFLLAEINGGLDENYQDEANVMKEQHHD